MPDVMTEVPAWLVCEGDVDLAGVTVAAVYREVVRASVRIIWSDGRAQDAHAETPVWLRFRPLGDFPGPKPGRVEAARMWLARALDHP